MAYLCVHCGQHPDLDEPVCSSCGLVRDAMPIWPWAIPAVAAAVVAGWAWLVLLLVFGLVSTTALLLPPVRRRLEAALPRAASRLGPRDRVALGAGAAVCLVAGLLLLLGQIVGERTRLEAIAQARATLASVQTEASLDALGEGLEQDIESGSAAIRDAATVLRDSVDARRWALRVEDSELALSQGRHQRVVDVLRGIPQEHAAAGQAADLVHRATVLGAGRAADAAIDTMKVQSRTFGRSGRCRAEDLEQLRQAALLLPSHLETAERETLPDAYLAAAQELNGLATRYIAHPAHSMASSERPTKPELYRPNYIGAQPIRAVLRQRADDGIVVKVGDTYYCILNAVVDPGATYVEGYVEHTNRTMTADLGRAGRVCKVAHFSDYETYVDDQARHALRVEDAKKKHRTEMKAWRASLRAHEAGVQRAELVRRNAAALCSRIVEETVALVNFYVAPPEPGPAPTPEADDEGAADLAHLRERDGGRAASDPLEGESPPPLPSELIRCSTARHLAVVDEPQPGKGYRYRSWQQPSDGSGKPSLELDGGAQTQEGRPPCEYTQYSFPNAEYEYTVGGVGCTQNRSLNGAENVLRVWRGAELLLEAGCGKR